MDKEFKKIMLFLLKSMDSSLQKIQDNTDTGDVELDLGEEGIIIPKSIYKEICEIIESDHIDFMGIS